ncbi:hypothetical protein PRIPAC_86297 [Pristionchus pacificus]|nr:hypothetical protein PRIPAC_86297 [Pristionchus pacificus]|eukprot:PDM76593.1 hypothetical protein PRIPAC_42959 [Pristionchus pacificus]
MALPHGFGCTCKSCRYPRRQGPQPGGGTHQRPQQNLTLDGATLASLANLQGGQCALSRQITNLSNLVSQMMERIENNPPLASSQLVAITSPAGPQSHIAPIPYPAAVTYQAAPQTLHHTAPSVPMAPPPLANQLQAQLMAAGPITPTRAVERPGCLLRSNGE